MFALVHKSKSARCRREPWATEHWTTASKTVQRMETVPLIHHCDSHAPFSETNVIFFQNDLCICNYIGCENTNI